MIYNEFDKLSEAKSVIRRSIQRKETGLKTSGYFEEYPPHIQAIHTTEEVSTEGLIDYSEDWMTSYTVDCDRIRDYAFHNWTNLTYLTIENGFVPLLGPHVLERTNIKAIFVPQEFLEQYKTAEYWKDYADIIQVGTAPTQKETILVEHLNNAGRTVDWINSLSIEQLTTDNRV